MACIRRAREEELGIEIDIDKWLEKVSTIRHVTAVTQLRSFAYRFQVRDVLTNNRLFKMKLCDTAMCYICKNAVETISHLYWDCERNKRLWERLKELLFQALGFNLTLNPKICLLELMDDTNKPLPPFIRQILLLCKQYIHN